MRWCARRGFRRVCLSLAFVLVFLHLLLTLHSLAVEPPACLPLSPPGGLSLRGLAPTELLEETPMVPGSEAYSSDSPAGRHSARAAPPGNPLRRKSPPAEEWGGTGSVRVEALAGPGAHQPSQLEALFSHGLYNLPSPPVPEDDWLLRMKPKVMASEKSSQLWVSASENVYEEIRWNSSTDSHPPWLRFHLGISRWQLYPHRDPNMVQLSRQLASHRIVSAVQKSGGTQLKLVMSFPNYGQALFKPMKQERDEETNFNLYYFSDFERHNAEISAFHLDGVLGYRRVPPVVGRLVDVVKEIKDVTTDPKLAKTFFTSPVGNRCFYGVCSYYCSTEHAVCGRPRALEGSLAVMLPDDALAKRKSWRSPWRRSYSRSKLAEWETNPDYCAKVKKSPPYDQGTRLLDLIDMAVLDFLMSNMDRHHYETFEKFGNDTFLIHLDNGRAFGRHSKDEPSILAPLKQCCRIRRSTWLRLLLLSRPQYRLSDVMREALSQDPLAGVAPLLSEPHLAALDRRLATVLRAVRRCQKRHDHGGGEGVIHDDIPHYQSGVTPSP